MSSVPLHPAVVHVPLGLAVVVPLLATVLAIGLIRGFATRRGWRVVVALQLLIVGGAIAALQTGEREQDLVARVVEHRLIDEHEDAADAFFAGSIVALVLGAGVLVAKKDDVARRAAVLAALASFGVAGLALRAGHRGGELVYRHGAASAYGEAPTPPASSAR